MRRADHVTITSRPRNVLRRRPFARALAAMLVGFALLAAGCSSSRMLQLRGIPKSPLTARLGLTSQNGPRPTDRTQQFLRVHNLEEASQDHRWSEVLPAVQAIVDDRPSPENIYAIAELAFIAGKQIERNDAEQAIDYYGMSTFYAYRYLLDPTYSVGRNPYDPQFRGACDLYNGALEATLRLYCGSGGDIRPGHAFQIHSAGGTWIVHSVMRRTRWRPQEVDHFRFASDYEIKGLKNYYRHYGLGVPLIAVRAPYEGEPAAARYYPPNLSFPITAFLRTPMTGELDEVDCRRTCHLVLEFYDTLAVQDARVAGRVVPLETDLTTPLAYFLADPKLNQIATVGLLRPDELLNVRSWAPGSDPTPIQGIYMVQPFEPDKIPVVLVHGLWSSPMTWMEMFNDLRSQPEIRENYQFWFYLYPSAQPFWVSAAQMRDDLAELRRTVDPQHNYPAMDQMVLVGHSMGGLVSRLQTIDSGDAFWRLVSDAPFEEVRGNPQLQEEVEKWLFFRPNRSIRRVVTIGTPHRGSEFSNSATQWISDRLIALPRRFGEYLTGFTRDNSDLIRDDTLLRIDNSVDSLSPDSPFFPVMLASHRAPWVRYHNIIGILPRGTLTAKLSRYGDGVVPADSAHVDDAESEIQVTADHTTIHATPKAILEVRRILLEHLATVRRGPLPGPSRVRMAREPL